MSERNPYRSGPNWNKSSSRREPSERERRSSFRRSRSRDRDSRRKIERTLKEEDILVHAGFVLPQQGDVSKATQTAYGLSFKNDPILTDDHERTPSEPLPLAEWTCASCDQINKKLVSRCRRCGKKWALPDISKDWKCKCGTNNIPSSTQCRKCKRIRALAK